MKVGQLCATAALGLLSLATAQAAPLYQYNLSVSDSGATSFAGAGTIGFNTLSGSSSAAPALEVFEFAVTTLRSLAYARGVVMPASPLGKIKMVSQVVAILALILAHGGNYEFLLIGQAALWVVVVTALVSAADYFRRFNLFLSPRV